MAIDTLVPKQSGGESAPSVRTTPLVIDQKMLNEGEDEEGSPPLRDVLTNKYGEQGQGWEVVPLRRPTRIAELFAETLKIKMYQVVVVEDGRQRVLEGDLPAIEEAPNTGARVVEQFKGSGEERMLLARSNQLRLNLASHGDPPLRETFTEAYGPETDPDRPSDGGWYAVPDLPQSREEHLTLNMGFEPVEVYLTMAGLAHVIERQ